MKATTSDYSTENIHFVKTKGPHMPRDELRKMKKIFKNRFMQATDACFVYANWLLTLKTEFRWLHATNDRAGPFFVPSHTHMYYYIGLYVI